MKKYIAFLVVFLLGLALGFPIGARVGLWEFMLADAQYKASILSTEIGWLKAGKPEPVITGMEISLDGELAKHGQYMESRLSWLWPELKPKDERAIRRAVAYRLAHPYQPPDHAKPENWNPGVDMQSEFVQQVIEGQRIQKQYLRKVLEHYAPAESGLGRPFE